MVDPDRLKPYPRGHSLSDEKARLGCGLAGAGAARLYFRIFGVIYGLVALLGFVQGDTLLLGLISNNRADAWLHVAIALVSLALGFAPARPGENVSGTTGSR